jgi:DNA-3-methyladenine glycosylase II
LNEVSFAISARSPFRLDLTAWALRRRPNNRIDRWDGQVYRRLLPLGSDRAPVEVAVRQSGPVEKPELQVSVAGAAAGPQLVPVVALALERLLGLSIDLSDFYALAERDPRLAPLARRFYGLKPPRFPSVFEALANAIACQQVTLTLGILLLNRLARAYAPGCQAPPGEASGGDEIWVNAFPLPENLAGVQPEALRPLGFSRQKARYLVDLAGALASGLLDLESLAGLDDEEALTRLRQLRGVGRWSAEYSLLRGLGRLHVFPGDDVGARNNLRRWLDLPQTLDYEGVRQAVARWQPYSGLVYLHLLLDSLAAHLPGEAENPANALSA